MTRGRKILLLLLCGLILCNLTGCSLIDNFVGEINENKARDTITNDSQYAMSKSTKEAQEKLNSAMDAKTEVEARNATISSIPIIGTVWKAGGYADKLTAMSDAAVQKNYEQYENAKATDNVYQSSVKAAEEKESVENENKLKQYLPYIIVAIVAIVVLLALLLLMKKRGKTATPVVRTPRKEPAPVSTTGQFDKAKAYQEKQLQELCAQGGIDYNLVIAKYGDDVKGLSRAYMALESPIRNGASQEEIMSKLK